MYISDGLHCTALPLSLPLSFPLLGTNFHLVDPSYFIFPLPPSWSLLCLLVASKKVWHAAPSPPPVVSGSFVCVCAYVCVCLRVHVVSVYSIVHNLSLVYIPISQLLAGCIVRGGGTSFPRGLYKLLAHPGLDETRGRRERMKESDHQKRIFGAVTGDDALTLPRWDSHRHASSRYHYSQLRFAVCRLPACCLLPD